MASYLPPEVIQQILLKLPVKSIVVCTCVCKFWYNFIKDPNFITTHLNKTLDSNKIHDHQLLLVRLYFDSQERYSLYADKGDELEEYMELSLPFESCDMCFKVMGSCNGLVCLVDNIDGDVNSFILWNPLIEKVLIVPKLKVFRSNGPFRVMVGFGFDCCCNDYKVLRILQILDDYRQTRVKVELFSVKKGYWRNVSSVVPEVEIVWCRSLAFVNGAMHCIGFKKLDDGRFCNAVLGFDVSEEVFFEIMLPPSLQNGKPYDLSIRVYKDSSIAVLKENLYSCQIWVMREYGAVESWTKLVNIVDEVRVLEVLGFRKNGEVLLEKFGGGIVSFDPESKRVQNHGIRGKEGYSFVGSYVESLVLLDMGNTARF